MNWQRGLFRGWVLLSGIWIAGVAGVAAIDVHTMARQTTASISSASDPQTSRSHAKIWPEVVANPEFLALPPDEQEAARNQYFNEVVAPDFPPESLEKARQYWDERTLLPGHKIRLSDFTISTDHQANPGSSPWAAAWTYLALAFVPPILSLALGLGLRWTLAGFRP